MKRYRLVSPGEGEDHCWLWADGSRKYFHKLQRAFPDVTFDFHARTQTQRFTWCVRVADASREVLKDIEKCLRLFQRTLWIEHDVDECFALGWHSVSGTEGKPQLSALGQWVHLAKSYGIDSESAGNVTIAGLIADQMVEFVARHPLYRSADGLVCVLPSNPEKTFDLPAFLAEKLAAEIHIPHLADAVYKRRRTAPMKYCITLEEKWDNVSGSVGVRAAAVAGKNLMIIDDILESGVTLSETSRALRESNVKNLYALVATKTLKLRFS